MALPQVPHVVIVGAGFGGLQIAHHLVRQPVRISVIGRHNHLNDRARQMLGLTAEELHVGATVEKYIRNVGAREAWEETETRRAIDDLRAWMAEKSTTSVERHSHGGTILNISCQPMPDGGAIPAFDDVTEVRNGQRQIAHMAFHDALTRLPAARPCDPVRVLSDRRAMRRDRGDRRLGHR